MIVFLNGASSSGKSTIASELQNMYDEPLLAIGIDAFLKMMPKKYLYSGKKASEGFRFNTDVDEEGPITHITAGPFGEKVCDIVPKLIDMMAENSFNMIVDEVLFEDNSLKKYVKQLYKYPVYFIGIHCGLSEISRREISRGNRILGLGRAQVHKIHGPTRFYDLELDTTEITPFDSAKQIMALIKSQDHPNSFQKLYGHFYGEN